MSTTHLQEIIWQLVASVPPGKVATYGQVARLAGYPTHARFVGTTLKRLPKGSTLPWHRILNSKGEISMPPGSVPYEQQVRRLGAEGVRVVGGRVSLRLYQWGETSMGGSKKKPA